MVTLPRNRVNWRFMENRMSNAWLERWENGHIGWHEADGNRNLQEHWSTRGRRVLVPLCGKTPDLLWLEERDNDVVGVELSAIAAQAFFEENDIAFRVATDGLKSYVGVNRNISIVCADYFETDFGEAAFDACYDRGALIALPETLRPRYVAHTRSVLSEDASQLLITVEYDQSVASGPPFSVDASEVLTYWPDLVQVSSVDDIDNCPPKFLDAGLTEFRELAWLRNC